MGHMVNPQNQLGTNGSILLPHWLSRTRHEPHDASRFPFERRLRHTAACLNRPARPSDEVSVHTFAHPSAGDLRNSYFTGKWRRDGPGVPHIGCLLLLYPFSDLDAF
jgi:hypothetical protein